MAQMLTHFYCATVIPEGKKSVKINSQADYAYLFDLNSEAYQFCERANGKALAFMREMGAPKLYLLFNPQTCESCIPEEYPLEERMKIQEEFISFLLKKGNWDSKIAG